MYIASTGEHLSDLLFSSDMHCTCQVQKAIQQYSLQGVHSTLQPYLNQAIWQHLEGIVTQACKMASQRADLSRWVLPFCTQPAHCAPEVASADLQAYTSPVAHFTV